MIDQVMARLEKQAEDDKEFKYELLVIGNTNVGKSTFLASLTGMKDFFNTSTTRETNSFWKFKVDKDLKEPFAMHLHEVKPAEGIVL
jgi:GTP-binding protein EngB required for normal cell division